MSVDATSRAKLSRRSFVAALAASGTLPALPSRAKRLPGIACLDSAGASTLLALGVTRAAVASLSGWAKWVGEPDMPEGVADIGSSWEVSFEVLAALKPDLILTSPFLAHLTPRLGDYGPVLSLDVYTADGGPVLPKAFAATERLGGAIGEEGAATGFLNTAEAIFDDCAERLVRLSVPPVAIISFLDERHVRVYSSPGLYDGVLTRLGVENAWRRSANYWGYETLTVADLARISDPQTQLIIMKPVAADILSRLEQSPLWQALPFAAPERRIVIPPVLLFGMVSEATRFAGLFTEAMEQRA
ncbi:ABC transporter substrate-binding protein [Martelella soudanensis]|uniref:ABC transporter substrate-binding protein n=1 Tax=unclassified Martelella TaxID=2629616 RepID=UPI0015DE4F3E|nr:MULTISPECIES: ABC transporter substrate-binding protein [unclassified Martelella]